MLAEYGPLLCSLDFDPGMFDDAELFLIAGAIIRDSELTARAVKEKLVDGFLPEGARQEIILGMLPEEKLVLKQRVINGNRWLQGKLSPAKPKRGPALTAF
jgi:hypothetical protein